MPTKQNKKSGMQRGRGEAQPDERAGKMNKTSMSSKRGGKQSMNGKRTSKRGKR